MVLAQLRLRSHQGLGQDRSEENRNRFFLSEEYRQLLDATNLYSDRPSVDKHNSLTIGGERIRALIELMQWTGLRIRDAVTLQRHRLQGQQGTGLWQVIVYQHKTGDPVYCPIPPRVAKALNETPAWQKGNTNAQYFFWNRPGKTKNHQIELAAEFREAV